jgi:hypothetical protein
MHTPSLLSLFAFGLLYVSKASQDILPSDGAVHTSDSWAYDICGSGLWGTPCYFVRTPNTVIQRTHHTPYKLIG